MGMDGYDPLELGRQFGRNGAGSAAAGWAGQGPGAATAGFSSPVPASALTRRPEEQRWLWTGCLARGTASLLAALWKVGKSTLLAHLLRSLEGGGCLCGLDVQPCRVLYVTEEAEDLWADRRDDLGIGDHVRFQVRPFLSRPTFPDWIRFLDHLTAVR